jgi:hypothetical protein
MNIEMTHWSFISQIFDAFHLITQEAILSKFCHITKDASEIQRDVKTFIALTDS